MRIGIVCEGVHDFPVIDRLVKEIAAKNELGDVTCHPLQPSPDASSRSGDGGWAKVVAWCKANAGNGLDTYFRAPLFDGEDVFDVIIVHLDGDIAEACADKFGHELESDINVDRRVSFLSSLLRDALKPSRDFEPKIRTAIPTQMTESWVLAAISPNEHEWESVEAKSILLRETAFPVGRPGKAAHYRRLADQMVGLSGLVRERCKSYGLFEDQFSA